MEQIIYTMDNNSYILLDRVFLDKDVAEKFILDVGSFEGIIHYVGIVKRGWFKKELIQIKALLPYNIVIKASKIL